MRNKLIKSIAIGLILSMFFSCGKKTLNREDYAAYVTDKSNGFVKSEEFDDIEVEIFYQPLEYVYLKERKDSIISITDFEMWKKEKSNYEFYTLRLRSKRVNEISQHTAANFNEYGQYLDYFVSEFQNNISKVSGIDTLPCALYHYERNFGISANNNFNLVFSKDKNIQDKIIIINLGIYDLGNVKFKFKEEDIKNSPSLAFGV